MSILEVSAAARRLGVTTRQVQHLVAEGRLRQVARGLVDAASVDRLELVRHGSSTRAWSEATAWAAVALLSGVTPDWLGPSQRSRLKGRLRQMDAAALVERARGRASVTRYGAHDSTSNRLLGILVYAPDASRNLGLTASSAIDGYLDASDLAGVVSRHGLERDDAGRVTLRATGMDLDTVRQLAGAGVVLTALDLAESLDARERRAGLGALDQALEEQRG